MIVIIQVSLFSKMYYLPCNRLIMDNDHFDRRFFCDKLKCIVSCLNFGFEVSFSDRECLMI